MIGNRLKMSLLPALQAILETASVTRAAERMNVTQSTMSRTLGQLRDVLNDPVLVRSRNRIYLSEKATRLKPLVNRLMADSETLFDNQTFSPETCQHHFRVASGGNVQPYYLAPSLQAANKQAPGMTFDIATEGRTILASLEAGELDLGLVHKIEGSELSLPSSTIAKSALYVLVRKDHPLAVQGFTALEQLEDYSFIAIHSPLAGEQVVLDLVSQLKTLQSPWLIAPVITANYELLTGSDSFMLTTMLGDPILQERDDVLMLPLPVEFPGSELVLTWPEHWHFHHAHMWLRRIVEEQLIKRYECRHGGPSIVRRVA